MGASSKMRSRAARVAAASVTSKATATASPPASRILRASSWAADSLRFACTYTRWPMAPSRWQIAAPSAPLPPVTSARTFGSLIAVRSCRPRAPAGLRCPARPLRGRASRPSPRSCSSNSYRAVPSSPATRVASQMTSVCVSSSRAAYMCTLRTPARSPARGRLLESPALRAPCTAMVCAAISIPQAMPRRPCARSG